MKNYPATGLTVFYLIIQNCMLQGPDIFVRQPLQFDAEPYNFLKDGRYNRKAITGVLETIKTRIRELRLPVKVVALATGTPKTVVDDDECCCLSDLELQFQLLRKQLLCCIRESLRFWGSLEKRDDGKGNIVTGVSLVDRTNYKMIGVIEKKLTHGVVENAGTGHHGRSFF
jgi:hypothetical protein